MRRVNNCIQDMENKILFMRSKAESEDLRQMHVLLHELKKNIQYYQGEQTAKLDCVKSLLEYI